MADNFKPQHESGHVFSGKMEGGVVKIGDKVLILPLNNVTGIVKTIEK